MSATGPGHPGMLAAMTAAAAPRPAGKVTGLEDLRALRNACPTRGLHTEPDDTLNWPAHMAWLAAMAKTHRQSACAGCKLWHIWTRKATG